MRAVLQRVSSSEVNINNRKISEMGPGIVLLLGIRTDDEQKDIDFMVNKTLNLRIFEDHEGKMNLSLLEAFEHPQCLVVSNFTIYGDSRKGRRPSFIQAAKAEKAIEIYDRFINEMQNYDMDVLTGQFGAEMDIKGQGIADIRVAAVPAQIGMAVTDAVLPGGYAFDR